MTTRRIHLHGKLRSLHDGVLELDARTVAEAVNGLCKLLKIRIDPVKGRMPVKVLGFDTPESIMNESTQEDLHIFPAFTGSKGAAQIVIGALIIIAAFVFFGPESAYFAPMLVSGSMMILGGILELLTPTPKGAGPNRYLGTPGNTTNNGTPIPLLFGTMMAFGQYLSFDIQSSVVDNAGSSGVTGSSPGANTAVQVMTPYGPDGSKAAGDVYHASLA